MAAFSWSCRLLMLYIAYVLLDLISAELSPRSGYVTLSVLAVRKSSTDHIVSIRYRASSKPSITWQYDTTEVLETDLTHGLENDFSTVHQNGFASVTIPGDAYRYGRPEIRMVLRIPDFKLIVELRRDIPDRYASLYSPIYFDIGSRDVLDFNKGEQLNFTASVRSEDLQQYDVRSDRLDGVIRSFDYDVFPPEQIQRRTLTEQELIDRADSPFGRDTAYSPFVISNTFEDVNVTVKTRACRLNTSVDYIAGKASLSLTLRPSSQSFIDFIYFERNFYVKEAGHDAPFRENSAVLLKQSMFSSDVTVRNSFPEVSYSAYGYPKPELTLKRGCGSQVELIPGSELNVGMYTTTVKFRFPPVNISVTETYTLTTKSGTFAVSDFVTFERST